MSNETDDTAMYLDRIRSFIRKSFKNIQSEVLLKLYSVLLNCEETDDKFVPGFFNSTSDDIDDIGEQCTAALTDVLKNEDFCIIAVVLLIGILSEELNLRNCLKVSIKNKPDKLDEDIGKGLWK